MDDSEQSIRIPQNNLKAMRKQLHGKEDRYSLLDTKQVTARQASQPDQMEDSNMDPPAMPSSD